MLLPLRNRLTTGASEPDRPSAVDAGLRAYARSFAASLIALGALLMVFLSLAVATAAEVTAAPSLPEHSDHKLGEHPAVIVQRLHARQGFDYEGSFYPHPAWLFLSAEAPRPMMDHPAVIVFKRNQDDEAARLATPAVQARR